MSECKQSVYLAEKSIDMIDAVNMGYNKGRTDGVREFAEKIKSEIVEYWYRSELDMGAENVNSLIDNVLAEWQKEADRDCDELDLD